MWTDGDGQGLAFEIGPCVKAWPEVNVVGPSATLKRPSSVGGPCARLDLHVQYQDRDAVRGKRLGIEMASDDINGGIEVTQQQEQQEQQMWQMWPRWQKHPDLIRDKKDARRG